MFEPIVEGVQQAVRLILSGDRDVFDITLRSIQVSGLAVALACSWSIPISILLGLKSFHGKRLLRGTFNAALGVPTVTLGLLLYLLLSRSGPFGSFRLLYTVTGISIGQAILITPVLVSFAANALESVDPELKDLAYTLGASEYQTFLALMKEASWAILLSVLAAFNRAIAELGVAMIVGGNIVSSTRVLTTAIALETARGEIAFSIALAIILLLTVFSLSMLLNFLRRD